MIIVPHPIDILIAKLNRLEEKDLEAFRVVIRKTGHPTESKLLEELQMAVDLFPPVFEEEQGQDMPKNRRRLWPTLFGRQTDFLDIAPSQNQARRPHTRQRNLTFPPFAFIRVHSRLTFSRSLASFRG